LSDWLRDITGFLYEIGLLKRYRRTGWSLVGVPSPESVANQAREYQEQGHANVQPWIDTSVAVLATSSAKQIAHEAITQNSLSWLERAKQSAAGDH
jgi:hypothetical protein